MEKTNSAEWLGQALAQAGGGKLPPQIAIATGHEDKVMLWLERVGDAEATTAELLSLIALGEAERILAKFEATGGLIRKAFPVEEAMEIRERLAKLGTEVELVRPHSDA